jgi:hypothetical protein
MKKVMPVLRNAVSISPKPRAAFLIHSAAFRPITGSTTVKIGFKFWAASMPEFSLSPTPFAPG